MPQATQITLKLEGLMLLTLEQKSQFLEAGILSQDASHQLEVVVRGRRSSDTAMGLLHAHQFAANYIRPYAEAWLFIDSGAGVQLKENSVSLSEQSQIVGLETWKSFDVIPDLEGSDFRNEQVAINPEAIRPKLKVTQGKFFSFSSSSTLEPHIYLVEAQALEKLKTAPAITDLGAQPSLTVTALHTLLVGNLGNSIRELNNLATVAITKLHLEEKHALAFCFGNSKNEVFRLDYEPDAEFEITIRNFPVSQTPDGTNHHHHHPHHGERHFFHTLYYGEAILGDTGVGEKKHVFATLSAVAKYLGIRLQSEGTIQDPLCPIMRRSISRA